MRFFKAFAVGCLVSLAAPASLVADDDLDGTFAHPPLHADYPDPDIIRFGEDFYIVSSTFANSPGLGHAPVEGADQLRDDRLRRGPPRRGQEVRTGGRRLVSAGRVRPASADIGSAATVQLAFQMDFTKAKGRVAYSLDGARWTPVGNEFALLWDSRTGTFQGQQYAVFCYSPTPRDGHVDVDSLRFVKQPLLGTATTQAAAGH